MTEATVPPQKSATPRKSATRGKSANPPGDDAHEDVQDVEERLRQSSAKAEAQRVVKHLSIAERVKIGRIARAHTTREELADWSPAPDRANPVDLLTGQETSRVQSLVPVRHARMAASAFAFYRGGALIMAADLGAGVTSGLKVQLCGDAHLSNFGMFAAPDRSVVFDVNDFDETNPGPFEWDVKRLAASFVLAARDNKLPAEVGAAAAAAAAASYRTSMQAFAEQPELAIWYDRVDASSSMAALQEGRTAQGVAGKTAKKSKKSKKVAASAERLAEVAVARAVRKAQARDAWSAIAKLTEVVDGHRQFRDDPPLLTRMDIGEDGFDLINQIFREYRATLQDDRRELLKRYELVDMAHKVVGVGSVGLLAFVLLMRGKNEDDLMVLQVKEAQASVLEAFTAKSAMTKHGHRVVTGQRLMQAASDSFLGWIDGPVGRSFYVRQLRDMKWSPDPADLTAEKMQPFATLCGHTLARAHARSGDAVAIAAYLGSGRKFDKAITQFSLAYADQVEQDFALFAEAIADGRLSADESSDGAEAKAALEGMAKPAIGAAARKRAARKRPT